MQRPRTGALTARAGLTLVSPIFRVLYLVYRVLEWAWRRAQRRFTKPGLGVLGALFVSMIMGVDTDHNRDYQLFAVASSLALLSVLFTAGFRARFSATRRLPRFATAGTPLRYKVEILNRSHKRQAGLTFLEKVVDPIPSFRDWYALQQHEQKYARSFRVSQRHRISPFRRVILRENLVEPSIGPGEVVEVEGEVTALKRGVLRFEGLSMARTDPLGLCRSFSNVRAAQSVLVLPKRYRMPPIALPGVVKYQQGGVAMASHVGQSEEFVSLRDYRRGDPLRHIHWRSWAKAGKPVVKEFEDEFFVRHALVLDTFTDFDHSEVFEEAVSVAASFACTIVSQESLLDLLFVGPESYRFTAGRGLAHADQILEVLASVRVCRNKAFATLESLVLNHSNLVSGCICIFLQWDAVRQEFIRKLRALGLPVLVIVLAPAGQGGNVEPGVMAGEPERFLVVECGNVEQSLAKLGTNLEGSWTRS
jgi:hypothetical protein